MGKKLIIIRHAKSDWKNAAWTSDFDRPLNERGHSSAPEMAQRLVDKKIKPNLLVSSPAVRAFTTAKYFGKAWQVKTDDILTNQDIYEASVVSLLSIINQFDDKHNCVAMFGHNPGFTELVNYLTNGYLANLPTAGVVMIEFPFEKWAEVSKDTGDVMIFDYPKNLN